MQKTKRLWGLIALEAIIIAALLGVITLRGGLGSQGSAGNGTGHPDTPGAPSQQPSGGLTDTGRAVATVEGRTFTLGELYEELGRRYGATLLNQLLDREAIRLEGKALGVGVTPEEIDQELKRMQQGYDGEEQFYKSMKEQLGMTREQIREDMLYKLLLERIATNNIKISDEQVNEYISEHPEEFKQGVELHLAQIISANRELADKAYNELVKGADFAQVARDRSIDEETANGGGDLGYIEEGDPFLPASVMKVALTMKVGAFSQPIAIEDGRYAIIQLKERKIKKGADPQTVREQVRKQLALSEAPPLQELVKTLRIKYRTEIKDPAFSP
ncbi:peptidylprolyl isomerase [Paenibacillus chartarius]|uniref:peptidylprolyl isomerase n=1 Tax=Paenibacillus chartarius TaxID=747481 RepID=A0ABV6DTX0_9BACL